MLKELSCSVFGLAAGAGTQTSLLAKRSLDHEVVAEAEQEAEKQKEKRVSDCLQHRTFVPYTQSFFF